jgi:probable HAF family extracellular repeat protein
MRHGRLSWITGTVLLASLAAPFTGLAQEQAQGHATKHTRYTLVDIGTLGGPNSELNGGGVIANSSGTVVGQADTSIYDPQCDCYVSHAFKWRKGVMTDLGTLPGGTNSEAAAINPHGAIAGRSDNGLIDPVYGGPAWVATVWDHGEIQNLGTLGGGYSMATASINDRGQVVGVAATTLPDPEGFATALVLGFALPGNQWHATLWTNGTARDLGTLDEGQDSLGIFLNERSQVAGVSFTNSIPNPTTGLPTVAPFFWENGQMVNVGTFGGTSAETAGLNNRGQVVGTSSLAGDTTAHAFLWQNGTMRDLGTLGGTFSRANGLNDRGDVIGTTSLAGDQSYRAFVWRNGRMKDLGTLPGDTFSQTLSINASGQIVGQSSNDDGFLRACLWEDGAPPIDLNVFVPPGSDLQLHEPLFISDSGEIVGYALLPNGDAHVFVLIPKGDSAVDEIASAPAATHSDLTSAAQTTSGPAHAPLTPEMMAKMRARLAPRYRGLVPGRTR